MKIYLQKKENDETVYYQYETEDLKILNFENIKIIASRLLYMKSQGQSINIDVSVSNSVLNLYKTTLENVLKSVDEDSDLFKLYVDHSANLDSDEISQVDESFTNKKTNNEVDSVNI